MAGFDSPPPEREQMAWLAERVDAFEVDALYQAAREVVASDGTGRKRIDALAVAVRRMEAVA